jgi:hypothetical protein
MGTPNVVACILKAWFANKGFVVGGPSIIIMRPECLGRHDSNDWQCDGLRWNINGGALRRLIVVEHIGRLERVAAAAYIFQKVRICSHLCFNTHLTGTNSNTPRYC